MMNYMIDGFQIYEYSSENPQAVIFFAHANGIPALTYSKLWRTVAKELDVRVISYDMRGIGKTTSAPLYNDQTWGWKVLIDDHVKLFKRIKRTHPKNTRFILCGHSVGAWIALLATQFIGSYPLILCDPPLLRGKEAIGWFLLHVLKKRNDNAKSKKVLNRKISFESLETAYESLTKTPLLSKWDREVLQDYIEGSFYENPTTKQIFLRHAPEWEAHLFAQYPPTAAQGFMLLAKKLRHKLKPVFLVGGLSDACNPKAKNWIKLFFPQMQWIILPNAGHMFPVENQDLVLKKLRTLL